MSKMPAKKKSCFQITSVTQAQVAASSVADDTESLDDPDESRTEDVSSEVFEASRVEYETVVDRISSEETHNNIGGVEAPGVAASYTPQVGQLPAGPTNEGFRKTGVMGSNQTSQQAMVTSSATSPLISLSGVVQQQPIPPASGGTTNTSIGTSQPVVSSSTPSTTNSTASCSSRFRVIKLDHGTGEPFKRGRWTCMEFFEKDSEGSAASRSVDSTRHANIPDPSTDRDIGLGVTGGSMVAPATHSGQGLGSMADASASTSHAHSAETLQQQQLHHPNYSVGQQAGSGAVTQSTFSNKSMTAPAMQPSVGHVTSAASQNFVPIGLSSQSPSITSAGQTQTLAYPPQQQPMLQQIPLGHHLSNQSSGLPQNQADYYQQHQAAPMQPVALAGQTLPIASHSVGQSLGQGPSPVGTSADVGAAVLGQGGELLTAGGSSVPVSQPASTQMQHSGRGLGGTGGSLLGMVPTLPQQSVGPYASSGQPFNLYPAPPGVQNVPAVTVSTSVPPAMLSASSAASTTPNPPPSVLPPGQQTQIPPNGAGTPGNTSGAQALLSVGNGQVEGSPGTVEDLASQPPTLSGKDPLKPLMPENLQLTSPSVNSLFGITIPVDEDDDRNPSMAFYQAFQSGHRLQDSKAHIDSASGASVVAIDNKIEQAMDLVKSHLMYAVREEVEVLKEQIKELFERNSLLERENAVLKSLANNDQLSQLSVPAATNSMGALPQQGAGQLNVSAPLQSQPQVQHQAQAQAQPQQNQVQPKQHQAQPLQHQAQPQQHQTQPQQLYAQPQSQQHQAQPQQQQLHAQPQSQQHQAQAQAQQHQAQPQQHQANLEASQHPQQTQPNVTSA